MWRRSRRSVIDFVGGRGWSSTEVGGEMCRFGRKSKIVGDLRKVGLWYCANDRGRDSAVIIL
jgi:hypothetical protein